MYIFLTINLIIALWVYYDSQKHGYSFWKGGLWEFSLFYLFSFRFTFSPEIKEGNSPQPPAGLKFLPL